MVFSASLLGKPLASAHAEAASLFQLMDVLQHSGRRVHLLIFIDCLVVLDILRKRGRNDFHPCPKEVIHCRTATHAHS